MPLKTRLAALPPPRPNKTEKWVEGLKSVPVCTEEDRKAKRQVGKIAGKATGSSLVAVAHTIATGTALQFFIF